MKGLLVLLALLLSGCGQPTPSAECAPQTTASGAALTCERAVREAMKVLPDQRPEITRTQVLVGSATPAACGARLGPYTCEFVVFTFSDGTRQQVQLTLFEDNLTVASPGPY
jgi:hypothetical protein